jgi:SRSO17 transposase
LPIAEIKELSSRLRQFFNDFRWCMRTETRDTSEYGLEYVSGLLRMTSKRTMAEIGRITGVSGQNLQHFMSNSPWRGEAVIEEVQSQVRYHGEFQNEAMLIFDESADAKAGETTAGAGRQYNGRLGKIELSQVGVFASLVTPHVNTWIDGELYLPQSWFGSAAAVRREQVGIPSERSFQTKPELVWTLVQRIRANGVPFVAVAMDDLYGRNHPLRQRLDHAGIEYYGDVPANTTVFLDQPQVRYGLSKRRKKPQRQVIAKQRTTVGDLLASAAMERTTLTVRPSERGMLTAEFARCRVWTLVEDTPRQEWLLIRRSGKHLTYVLSNASLDTSLQTMAWRKSHRFFIERSNQDAKSELGWDDFQATRYRAWHHQLALTILASWFIADTRLDWMQRFQRDPDLLVQYETDVLPLLSVAYVRELLRAAMPLPQLEPDQAASLVIDHLLNRTRSRRSRLRRKRLIPPIARSPEL